MATPKQLFVLFSKCKVNTKGLDISVAEASGMISRIKDGLIEEVRNELINMGCQAVGNLPKDWSEIYQRAYEAGVKAANDIKPKITPMKVVGRDKEYIVPEGPCGFAWISFKGNTSFGRWAKKQGLSRKSYPSGFCIWISDYGQSMYMKDAHASAMAEVLREAGVDDCYSGSRMD